MDLVYQKYGVRSRLFRKHVSLEIPRVGHCVDGCVRRVHFARTGLFYDMAVCVF